MAVAYALGLTHIGISDPESPKPMQLHQISDLRLHPSCPALQDKGYGITVSLVEVVYY